MNHKAIVAGATGLVGQQLVEQLLQDSTYDSVTIIVRRSTGLTHPKLQEHIVNFNQLDMENIDFREADVFCTLGTTIKKAGSQVTFREVDFTYPLNIAKLAKQRGARQFLIITSIGANASSKAFYTRVKGELEDALRELGLTALHIFRPSLLLGNRQEFRFGERVAAFFMNGLNPLFVGSLRKYRGIHAKTVAKGMLITAKKNQMGAHVYESHQIEDIAKGQ